MRSSVGHGALGEGGGGGLPASCDAAGNRRQSVFFDDGDDRACTAFLAEGRAGAGVTVGGYCLMRNHVHLIMVAQDEAALREALGEAHRRYARKVGRHGAGGAVVERAGSPPRFPP